jgi:hypothetical protein
VAKLRSFKSALDDATKHQYPLSILLGNGFSRAFSGEFGYGTLRSVADLPDLTVSKDQLFQQAGTDDFETVMKHLQQSADLVELYEPANTGLFRALRDDADVIKNGLVKTLIAIHPPAAWNIEDETYHAARQFLAPFKRIFTINYDLLLYWTVLRQYLSPPSVVIKDGFARTGRGSLTWSRPRRADEQEIFYLHGAMHLYVEDLRIRKFQVPKGRMVERLQSNLQAGRYPLVVTEGSSQDKELRIGRNPYLAYCHKRLSRSAGALFIHGMAMSDNDQHILDAIARSRIEAIYIGLHGCPSVACDTTRAKAQQLARTRKAKGGRTLKVEFYDSGTAAVWGRT